MDEIRESYMRDVKSLAMIEHLLTSVRMDPYEIAKILHYTRRQIGWYYKSQRPKDYQDAIFKRNETKYGDFLGPTFEFLLNVKKLTLQEIIESAMRVNSDYDELKKEMGE